MAADAVESKLDGRSMAVVGVPFTTPVWAAQFFFVFGVRAVAFWVLLWLHFLKALVGFVTDVALHALNSSVALFTLPIRILTALYRERTLEKQLHAMHVQLEGLAWENKELVERLKVAAEVRHDMEKVFEEMEEEQDKALSQVAVLESKLVELKEENFRQNEFIRKTLLKHRTDSDKDQSMDEVHNGSNRGTSSWSSMYKGSGLTLKDIVKHADPWKNYDEHKLEHHDELTLASLPSSSPTLSSRLLERRRVVALYRSLFSVVLLLLVGMIIWKADNPCMPLVAALFTVVGMSLGSVLQYFSTINNKQAYDAGALLSINWFIIGALTFPSLPIVARALVQWTVWFVDYVASRFHHSHSSGA